MKRIFTLVFLVLVLSQAKASHLTTTHIQITHIQGFDYELKAILYTDPLAVPAPQSISINSYQRQGATFIQAFNLAKDTTYPSTTSNVGCPPTLYTYNLNIYTSTVNLSPTVFNNPSGYIFQYSNCCRIGSIHNIQNSSASGSSGMLMFPPVVDAMGNPNINSSPVLNDPINEVIVNQHPFNNFYGGFDPDGDSLAFELYTPFDQTAPSAGTVNPVSAPYPDPSTQMASINWAAGYSLNDQIHGMGPNPSPNRFQIDPQTGVANLYADETAPGYVIVGVWCQEFRGGNLIGSTFRDFTYFVSDQTLSPNQAPNVSAQTQSLGSWNGDTLEFSGSPVCVQISVTDPDTIADISLLVSESAYDDSDYSFVQSSVILQNQDTFVTALCFQPDSFLSYPSKMLITAMDEKCYESTFDTLEFYIRFNGYSNAGTGGNIPIPITPSLGNLDLFSFLNGNPNTGGTWLDLDNTGLLSNGFFNASGINSDVTYRFAYVDQQPNYPADTAELELEFFVVQNIGEGLENSGIKTYPNPANDLLTISGISEKAVFQIFDIHGKKVISEVLESGNNTINTTELMEGLYFYQYQNQRGKFLIHR